MDLFSKTADLVTFTEETLKEKLHFLRSAYCFWSDIGSVILRC